MSDETRERLVEWLKIFHDAYLEQRRMNAGVEALFDAFASQPTEGISPNAHAIGNELRLAFLNGAKWWEFHSTGGTMWQSDQKLAAEAADRRYHGDIMELTEGIGDRVVEEWLDEEMGDLPGGELSEQMKNLAYRINRVAAPSTTLDLKPMLDRLHPEIDWGAIDMIKREWPDAIRQQLPNVKVVTE